MDTIKKSSFFISLLTALVVGSFAGGLSATFLSPRAALVTASASPSASQVSPPAGTPSASAFRTDDDRTPQAVSRVAPAVVSILLSREVSNRGKLQVGGGTGFIVSSDGLIVTNRHVVADTDSRITVVFADRRRFLGTVVARDPLIDLAFVKIDAKGLPVVSLGDSNALRIGETAIAIGNTLSEFPNTVTKGIVSGLARRVVAGDRSGESEVIEEAIQTDAAINHGNSGGPLINLSGEVIGVNVAVSEAASGVGFAIPINVAKRAITSVKATGKIVRPWLGVRYVMITPEIIERDHLSVSEGALIVRGDDPRELAVMPGSPADKAGLRENDSIIEIGGTHLDQEHTLAGEIAKRAPGEAVRLKILSQGILRVLTVTLEEFKDGVQ